MHGNKNMSVNNLEEKFRSTGIDQTDHEALLKEITSTEEYSKLIKLIYMFGYSFNEHPQVVFICDRYIREPVPGLTAVCMRVVIDYWGRWQPYQDDLKKFLDLSIYDDWYDEVIFSASYVNRHRDLLFSKEVIERFEELISHPEAYNLVPLEDPTLSDDAADMHRTR